MSVIAANLQAVLNDIAAAAQQAGRDPSAVTLLAVSKTVAPATVRAAFQAGQAAFGENYVQEGLDKIAALADLRDRIAWHFIGPLQSNKTRPVAEHFDWVHAIDRLKIAERLSSQRPFHAPDLNVCLQLHVGGEASKGGVESAAMRELASQVSSRPASASIFGRASCTKFSPKCSIPALAALSIAALLCPFETARSVTESTVRPTARQASAMPSSVPLTLSE